jgi:hypothetical protein
MLEFAFKQAEDGNSRAAAIVKAFQGGQTGANAEYQAANKAYAQVLGEIDGWRLEMRRLEGVFIENDAFTARLPDDMLKKFPVYSERIKALQAMVDAKDFKNAEILRTAMEYEVVGQLRDTQGIALYFASEAYQADGTINHVVVELQGASKRTITLDGLLATGKDAKLDSLGYLNSFNENRANMFKELGHLGLFGGKLAAGEKLAAKGSKYFIRQLDAMRRAGCDLNQLVGKDLVEATFKVNAVRGDLDKVKAVLEAAGMTGESFANGVRQASDRLAAAGVQERQFADLAKFLTPDIEDLNRLEGTATATR